MNPITTQEITEYLKGQDSTDHVKKFISIYCNIQSTCRGCKYRCSNVSECLRCPEVIQYIKELIKGQMDHLPFRTFSKKDQYQLLDDLIKLDNRVKSSQQTVESMVLAFLEKEASEYNSFSRNDIHRFVGTRYETTMASIRSLLSQKKIKIVDFTTDGHLAPCYQIIFGKLPEISIMRKDSEEFKKLGVMSVNAFQYENYLNGLTPTQLLRGIRERGIKPIYALGTNGYSENYSEKDLKETIRWLKPLPFRKISRDLIGISLDEPKTIGNTAAQEPILLPDLREKERFKPRDLFRQVFNLFGYKLNLNITVERKKTIANTGQDLIDF